MRDSFANSRFFDRIWRDLAAPFRSRHGIALLVTLSLFAALVGPFGTYGDYSLLTRLFYWTLMVAATASVGHLSATFLERLLERTGWPMIVVQGALPVLVAVPVCLVVALISAGFGFGGFLGSLPTLYVQCVLVTAAVVILFGLAPFAALHAAEIRDTELQEPALFERLPPARRGRLLRLMAQDHYVEVVTDKGATLVSMRFRDAIAATAPEAGIQVHRSHWVALHAVTGKGTSEKRSGLRLCDGSFVPVGRTFTAAVKKAVPR